jgi:hypothetical protein
MKLILICATRAVALAVVLIMSVCIGKAADEPLIPTPLNDVLLKIRPGMTTNQVLAVLSSSYPKVTARMSDWDGMTGYMDYKLDERFTLSISSITRDGKEIVHDDFLMYLFDWQSKRRVDIRLYNWAGQQGPKMTNDSKI